MILSDGEKLILTMLCEIYEKLGIEGDVDPKFIQETIYSGQHWGLRWKYSGIFEAKSADDSVVSESVKILNMWNIIESSYSRLTLEEKAEVARKSKHFGDDPKFRGFDANNENHFAVAHYLIDDLKRFSSFSGRYINSHMPLVDAYRRMLEVFDPMLDDLRGGGLTVDQIVEVLNAQIYPESLRIP
jgi:hypothetical protein